MAGMNPYAAYLAQQATPPPPPVNVGAPPRVPPQLTMPQPTPGSPPPAPAAAPPPQIAIGPGGPLPGAGAPDAALAQYEAMNTAFLKALAADYAAHKISKDDLKKGASYTGTLPYPEWKKDNVQHVKEFAKAAER